MVFWSVVVHGAPPVQLVKPEASLTFATGLTFNLALVAVTLGPCLMSLSLSGFCLAVCSGIFAPSRALHRIFSTGSRVCAKKTATLKISLVLPSSSLLSSSFSSVLLQVGSGSHLFLFLFSTQKGDHQS